MKAMAVIPITIRSSILLKLIVTKVYCMKSVPIRSLSGPYFPACRPDTDPSRSGMQKHFLHYLKPYLKWVFCSNQTILLVF